MKTSKILFGGAILALISSAVLATTTFTVAWYGNPYAYTPDTYGGCYWTYTTSYGGSWGSQFLYVPNGACSYTSMQVNHSMGASQANVVLN
ncbi:MAG: hypothetical protein EOO07_23995 [Chitinophagaceae bacterium]|nr:MAG: hypothetical protein EOO07_23995 [Chitinophagaceae bacterium]